MTYTLTGLRDQSNYNKMLDMEASLFCKGRESTCIDRFAVNRIWPIISVVENNRKSRKRHSKWWSFPIEKRYNHLQNKSQIMYSSQQQKISNIHHPDQALRCDKYTFTNLCNQALQQTLQSIVKVIVYFILHEKKWHTWSPVFPIGRRKGSQ